MTTQAATGPQAATGQAPQDAPVVSLQDMGFRYRASLPAVFSHLTYTFDPGALTAVTGPSGCGKSTLLYIVALMMPATTGHVVWSGQAVEHLPDAVRAQLRASSVGFVFQDALLDPSRTVLDNVCEGDLFAGARLADSRAKARILAERFGVAHRLGHRPGQISGGQAQRVALCRALMNEPQVICADEPTGNLDQESAGVVWGALKEAANRGSTVIVATHDRALAADTDTILDLGAPG